MATSFSVSGKLASTEGAVRNPASAGHPGEPRANDTRFRCPQASRHFWFEQYCDLLASLSAIRI
jgi:hypothetical protein